MQKLLQFVELKSIQTNQIQNWSYERKNTHPETKLTRTPTITDIAYDCCDPILRAVRPMLEPTGQRKAPIAASPPGEIASGTGTSGLEHHW